MERFGVTELSGRVTGHLSAGEATRVNLCKAFLNRPELLLLDEPTASLDPDVVDKVRGLIRETQRESGTSIIYTSHNMQDIEVVCDRVIFLHRGRIIGIGTPAEIKERFATNSLEDVFIQIARSGDLHAEEKK
jgi:ABC-2 type transport system ATP-binding protein